MAQPVRSKMVLENRLTEVSRCEDALLAALKDFAYAASDCFAVKLALEEALANAIKHGNAGDTSKHVMVEYTVDEQQVLIQVCDEGPGFDPADVPDPTLDENLEKPHGRGVMLMRTYMNEVAFNETGNCVTLVKRRSAEAKSCGES